MLNNYPDVLNIHDLCEIFRIGKKTAYKILHEGKIPCRKIGRSYRIPKSEIIRYLLENPVENHRE